MIKKLTGLIILIGLIHGTNLATTFANVNLLPSGDFESGTSAWAYYSLNGGSFTTPTPGYNGTYQAQCTVTYASGNIQLYQWQVALEPSTRYRVTFSAYSAYGHDVTINIHKNESPYTSYDSNFSGVFDLGTTWKTFSYEFTSSGFSSPVSDARFRFWMAPYATNGEIYYFDDVKLEKGMGDFFLLFP